MSFTDPTYIEVFVKKQSGFQASLVSFLEGLQAGLFCSLFVFSLHLYSYDIDNVLLLYAFLASHFYTLKSVHKLHHHNAYASKSP